MEKQVLIKFAKDWNNRNPNLHLVGAYIHCDEPDGTVHMHIDYIPVAKCERGMKLQNSLAKALEQQGFHFENVHQTAQIAWQEREREVLTSFCRELGIDAQHNQGLSDDRKHLSKSEYIKEKEMLQEQINEELQPLKDELAKYREFQISENDYSVNAKKLPLPFHQKVSIPISDFEQIQEQAKAYRLMKDDVNVIKRNKEETNLELERNQTLNNDLNSQRERYNSLIKEQEERENTIKELEQTIEIYQISEEQNKEIKNRQKEKIKEYEETIQRNCEIYEEQLEYKCEKIEELKKAYISEKTTKEQILQQNEKLTEQLKEKEKAVSKLTEEKELLSKAIRFSGRDLVAEYQKHQEKLKQQRKQGMKR